MRRRRPNFLGRDGEKLQRYRGTVFSWKIEGDFVTQVQYPFLVRMSYASRTKLSCDSSSCTVLTGDYVFVTSGLGINQRMPLADWRIIIGDETIREEFLPLPAAEPIGRAPTVWSAPDPIGTPAPEPVRDAAPTAAAVAVAAAAAAAMPVGTKWRWAIDDENYCVAIQTKRGVLQVKNVSPYRTPQAALIRQNFATYEAWVVSLPTGGTITTTLPQDILSPLERRKKESAKLLAQGGTYDAILKLQQLWKVRTLVYWDMSINQRIAYMQDTIARMRGELQRITIEQDMASPSDRRSMTRRLEKLIANLRALKTCAAGLTPEKNEARYSHMSDYNKQRLYIHTSQGKLQIAYYSQTQSVAVRVPPGVNGWMNGLAIVKRLEDLPFSIGAELHLSVTYRRREIDLYASAN